MSTMLNKYVRGMKHGWLDADAQWIEEEVMSLFHYLDCDEAMRRCEGVILADLNPMHVHGTWKWLPVIDRFKLSASVSSAYIEAVATDWRIRAGDARLEQLVSRLSPAMIVRILGQFSHNIELEDMRKHKDDVEEDTIEKC